MDFPLETYELFVTGLKLSPIINENAKKLLQKIASSAEKASEIKAKTWIACSIYVAVQDMNSVVFLQVVKKSYDVTVSQLLHRAEINIMDFFHAMCLLKENFPLSNNTKQSFIVLERKYCIVSALYDKFEKMLNDVFSVESSTQGTHVQELLSHYKSLCWTLFLVAKAKVLWHRQELLATFHLLLCCIAEVINAAPTFILLPPFDNIVTATNDTKKILEVLSGVMGTSFDDVKVVFDCWLHVTEELMPESTLLELSELKAKYTDLYLQSGDIDESKFLDRDWHIMPLVTESNSPKKVSVVSVSTTLGASKALNVILQSAPNGLSQSLKQLFKLCSRSPTRLIKGCVSSFESRFIRGFNYANDCEDWTVAKRRYELASTFYYLMLDTMVRKEAARLSMTELTVFLLNEVFHRSLLACCTEVVLMSCGSVGSVLCTPGQQENCAKADGLVFPWVLNIFDVKAYHFFKVIDTFIKTAPAITQQIVMHLKNIENKILQSLAWVSDSPVFISSNTASIRKSPGEEPSGSTKNTSGAKSPNVTSSHDTSALSPGVNIFLNKVSRYAYHRVEMLSVLLKLDVNILKDIWICVEHVIYSKSYLLKDRHLDKIIMCCIYAICKVRDVELLFKTIIAGYNHLPDTTESAYKNISVEGNRESIISFYNNKFAPEIKNFVTNQFPCENTALHSSNAALSPLSPSYSLLGRRNIFVSPLKRSPFKNPNEIIFQTSSPSYVSDNQVKKDSRPINETISLDCKSRDERRISKRLRFDSGSDTEDQNASVANNFTSVKRHIKFED